MSLRASNLRKRKLGMCINGESVVGCLGEDDNRINEIKRKEKG